MYDFRRKLKKLLVPEIGSSFKLKEKSLFLLKVKCLGDINPQHFCLNQDLQDYRILRIWKRRFDLVLKLGKNATAS